MAGVPHLVSTALLVVTLRAANLKSNLQGELPWKTPAWTWGTSIFRTKESETSQPVAESCLSTSTSQSWILIVNPGKDLLTLCSEGHEMTTTASSATTLTVFHDASRKVVTKRGRSSKQKKQTPSPTVTPKSSAGHSKSTAAKPQKSPSPGTTKQSPSAKRRTSKD